MRNIFSDLVKRGKQLFNRKSNEGWTEFAPLRVLPEYTDIDLEKKQVTGIVKYNQRVYLEVLVDVRNNRIKAKGNLKEIKEIIKPFTKKHYIELIKNDAHFFIEHKVADPRNNVVK